MTIISPWNYPTLMCTPPWKIEGVFSANGLLTFGVEVSSIALDRFTTIAAPCCATAQSCALSRAPTACPSRAAVGSCQACQW